MLTVENVSQFLSKTVAPALRKTAADNQDLRKKLSAAEHQLNEYRLRERLEKIARSLEGKGTFAGTSLDERVRYIEKAAENADLDTLEKAADMLAPDGSLNSRLSEKVASGADAYNQLVATIMNG